MRRHATRRRILIGSGVAATGTIASLALATETASATVDGEFTIPDAEAVLADQTLQDVRITADVTHGFDANVTIDGTELELYVGATTDTLDMIARETQDALATQSHTGETTLNGSLMSASDFSIDDFTPSNGELRRTVIAELRFYALRNDEVVTEATQQASFDVVVSEESVSVDMTLDATGTVEFETSDG